MDEVPHYGQHIGCFREIFKVDRRIEFQGLVRKSSTSDIGNENEDKSPYLTSYFGGNYRKYEGMLENSRYILKLSIKEYPELAPVEYVCNKIAYHCGLVVPVPFTLVDLGKNEFAFVSRNFMEQQLKHATLNHIYHYLKPGPENYNVEELSNVIYNQTKSVDDVEMFFKIILFDALIGNHDRHGRNIAIIETAAGKRLTPVYDNP